MDDSRGEFIDWANTKMAEIDRWKHDPEMVHSMADCFLLDCLGACQWSDEVERIQKWFKDLPRWYA